MSKVNEDVMLTTFDNPYNPFDEFDRWWKEDLILGHDCCGLLARTSNVSDVASDEVNDRYIIDAIDFICKRNPFIYQKVTRKDFKRNKKAMNA